MRTLTRLVLVFFCLFFAANAMAQTLSLQALAGNQEVSKMTLSPDGEKFAYQKKQNGKDYIVVQSLSGDLIGVTGVGDLKPHKLIWAGNDHLIIVASKTVQDLRYRADHRTTEMVRAISFNLTNKNMIMLVDNKYMDMSSFNTNLGNIIGVDQEEAVVYIPVYDEKGHLDTFQVNVDTGVTRLADDGVYGGTGWYLDAQNVAIARTSHLSSHEEFKVDVREGGTGAPWNNIYKEKTEFAPFTVEGPDISGKNLILKMATNDVPFQSLYQMDMATGDIDEKPFFFVDSLDVEDTIRDPYTNQVVGVTWVKDKNEYHWFGPELETIQNDLEAALPGQEVQITGWSEDRSRFMVRMAKPGRPADYAIFFPADKQLAVAAESRPILANAQLGVTKSWPYEARDGLHIPAYLTLPPGMEGAKNLPLVVMPHGGPEARDQITYDWMMQVFATRGYAVLQPNFRGSDGYGWDFTKAGWGEWGKAMQDDISDGVKKLIADGIVDPKRVCIVGASYGGYSALAGGAFTPDLYQCIVSISGVGDLVSFVSWSRRESGGDGYWKRSMGGDPDAERSILAAASPERFAENFTAPVLLIHGKDDVIVPYKQSTEMERALQRAGKDVTLITQKEGDHWMSFESTRLDTARDMLGFVQAHIGKALNDQGDDKSGSAASGQNP